MQNVKIIGGDTETFEGRPFSFQFFYKGCGEIIFVDHEKATRKFLEWLDCLEDGEYVIYFHNLVYDLISLFYDQRLIFAAEDFDVKIQEWRITGIYAQLAFATLIKDRKIVHLRDTHAFFKTKLSALAEKFCPDLPKLNAPEGLGEKIFTRNDKDFCDYSMRDAEITYHVGNVLVNWHRKFDIPLSVSAPAFAAKVYKREFLKQTIPLPDKKKIYAALHSYHGGKNATSVKAGWYRGVTLLDINSAYPWAMSQIPDFSDLNRYKNVSAINPTTPLPILGVYKISGYANKCKWPCLFDHAFLPIQGVFENVWVSGPELVQAMVQNEVKITRVYGYYYDAPKKSLYSLRDYSEYFYNLKNVDDIEKSERDFYKLLLNSLYGKFIQSKSDKEDLGFFYDLDTNRIGREKNIVAGGLFHPFIATLITGFVRAKIHQLEHKYKAIHTATDGFFTMEKKFELSNELGGLKIEAQGDLLLFRNKLYILYGKEGKLKSRIFPNQKIVKYALHGFHGSVFDLERCYKTKDFSYEFVKVNKLKESLRRGLDVNRFEKRKAKLNIEVF